VTPLGMQSQCDKTGPRVRILLAPPHSLKRREICLGFSGNCRKWAQFRYSCLKAGPEKVHCWVLQVSLAAFFSGGRWSSPVSRTPSGECNAIRNRSRGESDLTLPEGTRPRAVATGLPSLVFLRHSRRHLTASDITLLLRIAAALLTVSRPPREHPTWKPAAPLSAHL
jgi:hypothetical protein